MGTYRIVASRCATIVIEGVEAESAEAAVARVEAHFELTPRPHPAWTWNEESDRTAVLTVEDVEEMDNKASEPTGWQEGSSDADRGTV